MAERVREALTRALYRAIEIGDAAAVRRALAYVQKIQEAGGFRQYEALCKKSLIALLEPKFPQIPAEVIPTIVEFWAHPGDYCMTFGPATLVRRGLEQIAARVATMNIS